MLFYVFISLDWIGQLYWEPEGAYEDYQFIDIIMNMFLAYNIIFNLHILPVNLMILFKETMLEIFPPLLAQDTGDNLDVEDIVDTAEPSTWWDWIVNGKTPDDQKPKWEKGGIKKA